MPSLQVFIKDDALRDAILESVPLSGYDLVHEETDILKAFENPEIISLVIDDDTIDKKTLPLLHERLQEASNRRVFLIGESVGSAPDESGLESFPRPIRLGHLLSRLSFHLKMRSKLQTTSVALGPWRLELHKRQIVKQDDGMVIRLTEKETALLDYLVQNAEPIGREELLAAVWGHDGRIDTHTLETHIYQLRRKLDPDGRGINLLVNEQGAYRLNRLEA